MTRRLVLPLSFPVAAVAVSIDVSATAHLELNPGRLILVTLLLIAVNLISAKREERSLQTLPELQPLPEWVSLDPVPAEPELAFAFPTDLHRLRLGASK